jgi:hypothetical protein
VKLCGFEIGLDKPLFVIRGAAAEGGAGSIGFMPMDATPETGAGGPHNRRWQS